jgi:hypothetical protein
MRSQAFPHEFDARLDSEPTTPARRASQSLRLRDAQWDDPAQARLAGSCRRDSFVEGSWPRTTDIPAVFERRARSAGQAIEVFNPASAPPELSDYMKIVQDAVPALKPDEIVLVFYANDFCASRRSRRSGFARRSSRAIDPGGCRGSRRSEGAWSR